MAGWIRGCNCKALRMINIWILEWAKRNARPYVFTNGFDLFCDNTTCQIERTVTNMSFFLGSNTVWQTAFQRLPLLSAMMPATWILGFLGFYSAESLNSLVVPTTNGPLRGVVRDRGLTHHSATWWGIRYAEPPVGGNRFKEPKAWKRSNPLFLLVRCIGWSLGRF